MKGSKGYTILEVLIFIAVSALIFVSAVATISGRQQRVQFNESVRDFESKIRDIINDVANGYYPSVSTITCDEVGGSVALNEAPSNDSEFGSNGECIYTGKIFTFTDEASQQMEITNLVGLRADGGSLVSSLEESKSVPMDYSSVIETYLMRFGLQVTNILDDDGSYGAIAVTAPFSDSVVNARQVNVAGVSNTSMDSTNTISDLPSGITDNDSDPGLGFVNTSPGSDLVICLEGGNGEESSLSIGRTTTSDVVLRIGDIDGRCTTP